MNEAETRAELIDPKLKESGWGVVDGSKILREYNITAGKIQAGGGRAKPLIADYVLMYQGRKLAAIEAKSDELEVGEGVAQAKNYAEKLKLDTTFASNGKDELEVLQKMIDAEQSDLFDVLTYISFLTQPISRAQRVEQAKDKIFEGMDEKHKEFLGFVLSKYEEKGVEELDEEKLPVLLNLKYHAIANAEQSLGAVDKIRSIFFAFQKNLYAKATQAHAYR